MLELRNDFKITEKSNEEEKIDYANTLLEAAKFKQKIGYVLGISSNESYLKNREWWPTARSLCFASTV